MRTLIDLFLQSADAPPRNELLSFRRKDGASVVYSSAEFIAAVLALRAYLRELGLNQGDRIALWSANCPEWHIADFACQTSGLTVVPVYATALPSQVDFVVAHSEARAILFAGDTQAEALDDLRAKLSGLQGLMALDDRSASWHGRLSDLVSDFPANRHAEELDSVRRLASSLSEDSLAGIVYTSGTTGEPKGVMLTHANIVFDLRQSMQRLEFRTVDRALSVLPLAHVFERMLCYGYFAYGISIAYGDPHDLRQLLPIHRPVSMGCVPRILEKILESVQSEIALLPARRRVLAKWMLNSSVRRVLNPESRDFGTLAGSTLAKPLLFRRVRKKLGSLQFLISGGAYLDPAVEAFFRAAGFNVVQGYGLTETSPVIALNALGSEGLGTVGPPLDGVEVRIDEEGQILTRGPHVMKGYYKDPEATEESLSGGWFHTGDLGSFDPSGKLRIAGRGKDTIVLSTGKKVSSSHVEQALAHCSILNSIIVLGSQRKFLSAVILPRWDKIREFAAGRNLPLDLNSSTLHPEIGRWISAEITNSSSELAEHERIKRFCLLPDEELTDPEIVTPTQKLRRRAFEARYAIWIDRMYTHPDPFLISERAMSAAASQPNTLKEAHK